MDVVEADDGDVAGDAEAELADGAHCADGGEVVGGEDGGGVRSGLEDALHRGVASVDAVVSFLDESGTLGEVLLGGAFLERVEAGSRGGEAQGATDECDIAVAEGG